MPTKHAFTSAIADGGDATLVRPSNWNEAHVNVYAPGSFTIADGRFEIMSKRLQLTGTQRLTMQGTGRLRIN
jgi:hypothetical protein